MSWILGLAIAVGGASHVSASVCGNKPAGEHWYAVLQSTTTKAQHGASVFMETSSLTSGAPSTDFVDHEMWYDVVASGAFWVEVGVIDGMSAGGGANQHLFWADNRNGGGFHEHFPARGWVLGTYYQLKVVQNGAATWDVSFGGTLLGTSTNNSGGSERTLAAGIETTRAASSDHVGGHLTNWARKDTNDNWSSDWDTPNTFSYCPADIDANSGTTTEVLHGPN